MIWKYVRIGLGSISHRFEISSDLVWDRFGIDLESVWGRFGINFWSVWLWFRVGLESKSKEKLRLETEFQLP